MKGLLARAYDYDPRGRVLSVTRTALASAQLSVLLATSDEFLFWYALGAPREMRCEGLRAVSLWCAGGSSPGTARLIAIAVLLAAASGYRPRYTCVPHWYVAFSLTNALAMPNGGESVGSIATLLLIPVCLGDRRVWQWTGRRDELGPTWRGAGYAAMVTLRLQLAVIYAAAAVSKIAAPGWRSGTALFTVAHDPHFGFPPAVLRVLDPVLTHRGLTAAATWSVLLLEMSIAVLIVGTGRTRAVAAALAVVLHVPIILLMGLFSFGTTMIVVVVLAAAATRPRPARPVDAAAPDTERIAP